MAEKGFLACLFDSLSRWAAVQNSKNAAGQPDPYKAAGIALGMKGDLSTTDILALGGLLGAEGVFDESPASDAFVEPAFSHGTDAGKAMHMNELSQAERQCRIRNANRTRAWHRYWAATWRYIENAKQLPPP